MKEYSTYAAIGALLPFALLWIAFLSPFYLIGWITAKICKINIKDWAE